MCDELRWCEVGAYGGAARRRDGSPLTPAVDRLAAEGVRFETAVSNCPICVPARTVVLSGQHARTSLGSTSNPVLRFRSDDSLDPREGWLFEAYAPPERVAFPDPTLPELLRDAGHHTRAIGKWHVDAWPHHLGFERYCIPRAHHAHTAQLFTDDGGPEFSPPGFSPDFERDCVSAFLREPETRERPWFLYYNVSPPHMPLADMPERYLTMVDPESVEPRGNIPDGFDLRDHADAARAYLWDFRAYLNAMPHAREAEVPTLRELTALYLGATAWVDDTLAAVLDALDASGQRDNTLVVFTSDHGDLLGSHGLLGKGTLHEESARVPLIARGPGVAAGHVDRGVASLLDVAPTLLRLAGIEPPDHMQGEDLGPRLAGGEPPEDTRAWIESADGLGLGLRTPDRLDVFERAGIGEPLTRVAESWDLTADPLQLDAAAAARQAAASPGKLEAAIRWDAQTPVAVPAASGA